MTKNTFTKMFSIAALLVLLTPVAASAHGFGLSFSNGLHTGLGKNDNQSVEHKNKDEKKDNRDTDKNKSASTSVSIITKASARIIDWADLMASMSSTIGAKIAGSDLSADEKADANANLSDYDSDLTGAKSKAAAAASVAANANADNASSTNASILAEARADLSAAWDLLRSAKESLKDVFHSIWGSK